MAGPIPALDHIVIVMMENTSASSIYGNTTQAPYLNSLANQYSKASNYFAITHPSLPNYLTVTGGSDFGITSDCSPSACPVNAKNIGDSIEAAGKSWKAYMEGMPSPCATTDSYPYVVKHNPFVYFNNIRTNAVRCTSHDVPFTQLAIDLKSTATTPSYAWITPDMCNDMHDCSINTGDTWLSQQVPTILNSPAFTQQNSALIVLWDEDDFSGTNQVAAIWAGPQVQRAFASSTTYNHYSLLKTVEAAWGLPALTSNDSGATPMSDFFAAATPPPPPPPPPATTTATSAQPLDLADGGEHAAVQPGQQQRNELGRHRPGEATAQRCAWIERDCRARRQRRPLDGQCRLQPGPGHLRQRERRR
jgi:acid phosphatase